MRTYTLHLTDAQYDAWEAAAHAGHRSMQEQFLLWLERDIRARQRRQARKGLTPAERVTQEYLAYENRGTHSP